MSDQPTLAEALAQCREDQVRLLVRQMVDSGMPPVEIIAECNRGMGELGNRFQRGECFIPELMFGGMVMKSIMADLAPVLKGSSPMQAAGKVVIGSVQHDVHDIGKDIVIMMLRGIGFEVVDLGVDVPPARFVQAIADEKPQVAGMSVLLTTCFKSVVATVEAVRQAGLRDDVRLMVGGAAASELLREHAQLDFYGKTAIDGVDFACEVAGVQRA
jgi:5-methyltetrahydrofolate--homocysteine methyltransferase